MRILSACLARLLAITVLVCGLSVQAQNQDNQFSTAVSALNAKNFKAKEVAILALEKVQHPRTSIVLQQMLDGRLYRLKADDKIIFAEKSGKQYVITDALIGEPLGEVKKSKIKKISVNNKLRSLLRTVLARLSLSDPDPQIRLQAVEQMVANFNDENATLLNQAIEQEQNPDVQQAMRKGLAFAKLTDADPSTRLAAISDLSSSFDTDTINRMRDSLTSEQDEEVKTALQKALADMETTRQQYEWLETLFFGLSLGSILFLAAIGLAITFGVMGVINMAHGELIMLGAYTTYLVQLAMPDYIDYSLFVAIPLAFLVSGLFGIAIERGIIRFLYGRPLETLLATFGLSLILQQLVRTTISAQNVPVVNPSWMSGIWQYNDALSMTYNRLYILFFALLIFVGLILILKRTRLGLQVRAVSQNRNMAKAMGIRTEWVDAITFGLGAGIAGIAGVALSQLTNVGPNLGQSYIVDSFMVVVFGGVGNLWGTLLGALSLGVINKFLEPVSGAVLAKVIVLIVIILFIQKRPQGLFPQKGRAAQE